MSSADDADPSPLVPVLCHRSLRSWPAHASGGRVSYVPLRPALAAEYATDAHFAAYSAPSLARRLGAEALRRPGARAQLPGGIAMVLAVFDIDCPESHADGREATEQWWSEEEVKVQALLKAHHGGFIYRTRGGYRIVYGLPEPVVLRDDADARAWSEHYGAWIVYLNRVVGICADAACRDWTRLFRLPHATREGGGHPERLPALGDPRAIGAWDCVVGAEDIARARASCGRPAPSTRHRSAPIPSGRRTTYGAAALRRSVEAVAGAALGNRNRELNLRAYGLGRLVAAGHLSATDAEEALVVAARANGYLEEATEAGVRAVIAAGLSAGLSAGPRGPSLPWAREEHRP